MSALPLQPSPCGAEILDFGVSDTSLRVFVLEAQFVLLPCFSFFLESHAVSLIATLSPLGLP